jgi:hypothetical protein
MKDEAKKAYINSLERAQHWALECNELWAREGMKSQNCRTLKESCGALEYNELLSREGKKS